MQHYTLLRNSSTIPIRLQDVNKPVELPSYSHEHHKCSVYSMTICEGKTLLPGQKQYAHFMRARRVSTCPVSTLGRYMFYRYGHRSQQGPPDPNTDFEAFTKCPLFASLDNKAVNYEFCRASFKKSFHGAGVVLGKTTHAPRHGAAILLELAG